MRFFVKFVYLVGMIADQNFYDICFMFFYPAALAKAYGQRPKFVRAEHSATAEGENCAYGPTLISIFDFYGIKTFGNHIQYYDYRFSKFSKCPINLYPLF